VTPIEVAPSLGTTPLNGKVVSRTQSMRLVLLSVLLMLAWPASAEAPKGWARALPEKSGEGLHTCSRAQPRRAASFWQLSDSEVTDIDRLLAKFISRPNIQKRIGRRLEDLGRQFLGLRRGSRRYVYINSFPADAQGVPNASSNELYIPCDRGPEFWGIEYDLEARQFSAFSPDGMLPPPHHGKK
jgi:hypothetical protein